MNQEHADEFKERMLVRSFATDDQMAMVRMGAGLHQMLPDTESVEQFEETVRDEAKAVEQTANVVSSVTVEDYTVVASFILGQTADEDMVLRLLDDFQRRIYEHSEQFRD